MTPELASAARPPSPAVPESASAHDEVASALVRTVHDYGRAHIRALDIDRAHCIPRELLSGLAELGLFGVTLPEDFGGAGLSAMTACRVVAALAEHDRSVATTVGLHLGLGTRGLIAFGTPAAKERFLPELASGRQIAAFATTEPGAGSDLSAIATKGVVVDGALSLTGEKIYVTNGGFAGVLTATVATPGLGDAARGTSVVAMSTGTPGLMRLAEENKLGLRGSSTITIAFDGARVPMDQVLGTPGKGLEHLSHILSWGRLLLSSGCVGTARLSLRRTLAHVEERRQFGRPLVAQEVVQRQLGAMATRLLAMRALVEAAAAAEGDWLALARLTSSAKVVCSEGAWQICDLALQLHGGSGYIEDTGLALPLRDARVPRIFEGANDVLLTHLGLMELTKAEPVEAARSELPSLVARHRGELVARHGLKVMGKKAEQHRLGVAVAWRDAAVATERLALREKDSTIDRLVPAVEKLAMSEARRALEDTVPADPELIHTFLAGRIP